MYDTIVVGLGAAGMTAANTLALAGRRVLGLEAQDRIGGRVYTVPFGDGVVELGAEWIHGERPSRVYDLAVKNNVSLLSQDISMEVYYSDGSRGDKEVINDLIEFGLRVVDEPPKEPQPLGQYITARMLEYIREKYPALSRDTGFVTELLAFMDLVIDNYEATTSWNEVSTESQYTTLEGDLHLSWHRHGYKTLFEILLNTYKNGTGLPTFEYKLNTEVTQIKWPVDPSKKVVVRCQDGREYTADNVIVTVSLGVLKEACLKERHSSLFWPRLPAAKTRAIEVMTIGVMDKILLLFPYKWWPVTNTFYGFIWKSSEKRKVPANYAWITKILGASTPLGSDTALTLWTSGASGILIETLPDEVVLTKVMELLRKFMGANVPIPEPIRMIRTTWHSNPYTRGSYTYDHVSSPMYPTARADLAAPLKDAAGRPRVLFAGEATHQIYFSTVHGACDTGHREAMRLLPNSKI